MIETDRKNKACREIRSAPPFHKIDGGEIEFATCVGNFYSPSVAQSLDLFRNFERGVLPYPGALADQPAKVIEFFDEIHRYRARKAEAERRSAELAKRHQRGQNVRR